MQLERGRGKVSPALFWKLKQSALILAKVTLIAVIYGLNLQFLRVSRRKNQSFFPAVPFFFVLQMIVYWSTLIPRKLLFPK